MLPSNYALFYSTTPENEGCVAFYGGCYDTIDAGETLQEPLHRVYVKYPNVIFSTVENIVDDDTTVIAGIMPSLMTKEYTDGTAIVDTRTEKSARVIINGNMFSVEQRTTQLGWKFKDVAGIKYKWNTPTQSARWELTDGSGSGIAALNFGKHRQGTLEILPNMDKQLFILASISLVFSIIAVGRQEKYPHLLMPICQ